MMEKWSVTEERSFHLAPGVVYSKSVAASSSLRETVYCLEVERKTSWIDWVPVSSHGKVNRLETVGHLLHQHMYWENGQAIAAMNGDFFSYSGTPSGLQMAGREILTSPSRTKALLACISPGGYQIKENVVMHARLHTNDDADPLALDAVNRSVDPRQEDYAVVYNWRYGDSTRTQAGGMEIVVRVGEEDLSSDRLVAGQAVTGVVESVHMASDSPIQRGCLVIAAFGLKAEWVRLHITSGMELTISIDYNQGVNDAVQVISANSTLGMMLLRDGEIEESILDFTQSRNLDRHPRTIAALSDDKLSFIVIDGRQPGYSDGMTLAECASYLQSIGMRDAMNLDGGGSVTAYARLPGDWHPSLQNSPSDGFERSIGNAVVLYSRAPIGRLNRLLISHGPSLCILAGSRTSFKVSGVDANWNPIEVEPEQIQWNVTGEIGRLDAYGGFRASPCQARGTVEARYEGLVERVQVEVTDAISVLSLHALSPLIDVGENTPLIFTAKDSLGSDVVCSFEALEWKVDGQNGAVTEPGVFMAGNTRGPVVVTAKHGDIEAECTVVIGKPHFVITGFEQIENLRASSHNAVEGSVRITKVARPKPVRFGTFSAMLSYDFTGQVGLSRAGVKLVDDREQLGVLIDGSPKRLGLWVYGDGGNHWLRVAIRDAFHQIINLNFTEDGGLDWHDWQYVSAELPQQIAYPIRVCEIYLLETTDANKNSGSIYLDEFRAEYTTLREDVTGPVFTDLTPSPNVPCADRRPTISAIVRDEESGIDPASIRMWLNRVPVIPDYRPESGRLEWQPQEDLPVGEQQIKLYAKDKAGNPSVPAAEWSLAIQ